MTVAVYDVLQHSSIFGGGQIYKIFLNFAKAVEKSQQEKNSPHWIRVSLLPWTHPDDSSLTCSHYGSHSSPWSNFDGYFRGQVPIYYLFLYCIKLFSTCSKVCDRYDVEYELDNPSVYSYVTLGSNFLDTRKQKRYQTISLLRSIVTS